MTREDAEQWLISLKSEYESEVWQKWAFEAFDMAIVALRSNGWVKTSESTVETLKQACPYCSWIDPALIEDDEVDGPQNYCRVCGRDLRR